MTVVKRYGCRRDLRDPRDHEFKLKATRRALLPPSVDLSKWRPPIQAQGELGSCTAQAITSVLRWHIIRAGGKDVDLSRLQLYFDEREAEKTINEDAGAEIRSGIKVAKTIGVGHESLWPYDISKFTQRPPPEVYRYAGLFGSLVYERITPISVYAVKAALASFNPVIIGISLFDSFESDAVEQTGIVPMPDIENENTLNGHCMWVDGYGQKPETFTVVNSWGAWGDKGVCYIPEDYLGSPKFGADYWVVRNVVGA